MKNDINKFFRCIKDANSFLNNIKENMNLFCLEFIGEQFDYFRTEIENAIRVANQMLVEKNSIEARLFEKLCEVERSLSGFDNCLKSFEFIDALRRLQEVSIKVQHMNTIIKRLEEEGEPLE